MHLVELPDEIWHAIEGRHEIVGLDQRSIVIRLRAEVDLDSVTPPLRGGIDRGFVEAPQRALGERREGPDLLDLVAEQLDPQRFAPGRGKDVDESSAHREVPPLLDALDAFVAGERQVLDHRVDSRLVARCDAERRRPLRSGGDPLGERNRGGADESAGSQDLDRAESFADEMGRRLEAGAVADAPAREEARPVRRR